MPWLWIALATALLHAVAIARAILRPHRQPESRLAWIFVMLLLPGLGLVAYLLVGETQVGRRRSAPCCRTTRGHVPRPRRRPGLPGLHPLRALAGHAWSRRPRRRPDRPLLRGTPGRGVRIFEFGGGLLHTKSVTVDGEITLIGSANLDRRSFDLNYENNLLAFDPALTVVVRHRQDLYLGDSHEVLRAEVDAWPIRRRLWNNALAMFGPIL